MPNYKTSRFRRFRLESGALLEQVDVAFQTWGSLNAACDNCIVVCHSLSGDSDVTSWWLPLIGPGKALDTEHFFVVCANLLGSCYGTTGPSSDNPITGRPYQSDFPVPTIRDNVRLQQYLLTRLGVTGIQLVIGGSIGGMVALEFSIMDERVKRLAAIATSGRHSAWCIGWTEAQRQAIYSDPNWSNGYYSTENPPNVGLASARMIAMLSYRNQQSFSTRFGREMQSESEPSFAVQSYLNYQGEKLARRFDANSYVRLTQTSNSHDVARGRDSYETVLSDVSQPTLFVGVDTDLLFPIAEQEELARLIPNAELQVIRSSHGHDAFLLEGNTLNSMVADWLKRTNQVKQTTSTSRTCIST